MDDWRKLHLQRVEKLKHLDEVSAVVIAARQWWELCDRLRRKGWRNITPALVAGLAPELPQREEE